MPLYEYKCPLCARKFERFLPLARYKEPQTCTCGEVAEKQLSATRIITDYAGYECPITGDWIEGRRAHEENLKKHGCRVLEEGEREQAQAVRRKQDEVLEDSIVETAMEKVSNLPAKELETLGNFLENHDVELARKSI